MKLTHKQKKDIIELHNSNTPSREIARIVLGRKSRKSTINDFLKTYKLNQINNNESLKTIFLDIETAPMKSFHWKRWKENIGQNQVLSESFIIAFSYQFLGEEERYFLTTSPSDVLAENDSDLVHSLYDILNDADIIIGHNINKFDIPFINSRMAYYNIQPPTHYRTIDTYRVLKQNFRLSSYKLGDVAEYFKLGCEKTKVDFTLWRSVMEGDLKAIYNMGKYCSQDVYVLYKLYKKIQPFISNSPVLFTGSQTCPKCGSTNIDIEAKGYNTKSYKYDLYRCKDCLSLLRNTKASKRINSFISI